MKFWKIISPFRKRLPFSPFLTLLLKIALVLLTIKLILQLLSAFPWFARLAFNFPDFVIGYLHWVFLGVVSIVLFVFLSQARLIQLPKGVFWLYFTAFLLTEALIFYKGLATWFEFALFEDYYRLLAYSSIFLTLSVGVLLFKNLLTKRQTSAK
jgi:hypothetical protein